jgi:ATP-binding cassette subfamily B protein
MNIKRIFHYYWQSVKPYKWYFFFLIFTYALATILAIVISPLLFKKIIDVVSNTDIHLVDTKSLFKLVLFFGANIIIYNIFYRIGDYLIVYFESMGIRRIAFDTFKNLSHYSYSFFSNNFGGSLIAKSRRFVNSFEGIIDRISIDFLFGGIKIISIFIVLFYYSNNIALFFLGWFVLYLLIIQFFIKRKMKLDILNSESDSKVVGVLSDLITNILNLKIFSANNKEYNSYSEVLDFNNRARLKSWNFSNLQLLVQGFFLAILQIGIIYISIQMWLLGNISTGTVVLVQIYMASLFETLWNLSRSIGKFVTDLSNAKEMVDLLDKPLDILDPKNPEELSEGRGEIEFKNVNFEYVEDNQVFSNLNLKIKAGEKVGLVGHSGSGKSTITKMLLRFVDVKDGEILIDGQNIKNVTQDDLRSKISYVPQEPILFHRSIGENIGYSKENATAEEIIESAKKAHAHEFISKLQNGYDTLVGERGIKLSGGERQRVAIARAMLKDSPILVLDEATSALDSISESYIKQALNVLMENKTAIVIAHRLSTISKMDIIIVLDKGQIVEEGTHEELISKDGSYAKLWNYQTGFLNEE